MVKAETLQKYALFGGFMEEQIDEVIPLMQQEKFTAEQTIIAEGKPNDKIYFIIEGAVIASKDSIVLSRLVEGEVFGEMEVLDVMPAVATVKATSPVTLMSISNKSLRELYKIDIKVFSLLIMNLARDLSRRLRKMDEKLTSPIFI
jgi:CRP-like cAMP-binding protein